MIISVSGSVFLNFGDEIYGTTAPNWGTAPSPTVRILYHRAYFDSVYRYRHSRRIGRQFLKRGTNEYTVRFPFSKERTFSCLMIGFFSLF
jgi:hypothetical protein